VAGSDEIMRALGRLEEGMERLRADFTDEKAHSAESRGRVHTKLEKIDEDLTIVGQVAAQARDKVNAVELVVSEDVKPATDDFKRMRTIGFIGVSLLGFAFTALGVTLATVGEGVVNSIRAWLRII
jgi:hypothetical protein